MIINLRAWYKGKMYQVAKLDMWGDPDQATCDLASLDFSEEELFGVYLHEVILMQFTGLKDKNGKEIYDGDIVEYKDFSNGMYLFKEQPKARGVIKINNLLNGIYLKGLGTFKGDKVEVIGNIHDNPEILKEG